MLPLPSRCVPSNASAGPALSNDLLACVHDVADTVIARVAQAVTSLAHRAGLDESRPDEAITMSRDREMPIA